MLSGWLSGRLSPWLSGCRGDSHHDSRLSARLSGRQPLGLFGLGCAVAERRRRCLPATRFRFRRVHQFYYKCEAGGMGMAVAAVGAEASGHGSARLDAEQSQEEAGHNQLATSLLAPRYRSAEELNRISNYPCEPATPDCLSPCFMLLIAALTMGGAIDPVTAFALLGLTLAVRPRAAPAPPTHPHPHPHLHPRSAPPPPRMLRPSARTDRTHLLPLSFPITQSSRHPPPGACRPPRLQPPIVSTVGGTAAATSPSSSLAEAVTGAFASSLLAQPPRAKGHDGWLMPPTESPLIALPATAGAMGKQQGLATPERQMTDPLGSAGMSTTALGLAA